MDDYKGESDSNNNKKKTVWNPLKKGYWNKDNLLGKNRTDKFSANALAKKKQEKANQKRYIKETKCTCSACGNVWFYGKQDVIYNVGEKFESFGSSMENTGKDLMCCGGCLPAAFIPEKEKKEVRDLNQCQKCGSRAVKTEEVTHIVE